MALADRFRAWWGGLSGPQRMILGVGVPVAGGAAIIANVRDRDTTAAPPPAGDAPAGVAGQSMSFGDNSDLVGDLGLVRDQIAVDTELQLIEFTQALAGETAEAIAESEAAQAEQTAAEIAAAEERAQERAALNQQIAQLDQQISSLQAQRSSLQQQRSSRQIGGVKVSSSAAAAHYNPEIQNLTNQIQSLQAQRSALVQQRNNL